MEYSLANRSLPRPTPSLSRPPLSQSSVAVFPRDLDRPTPGEWGHSGMNSPERKRGQAYRALSAKFRVAQWLPNTSRWRLGAIVWFDPQTTFASTGSGLAPA